MTSSIQADSQCCVCVKKVRGFVIPQSGCSSVPMRPFDATISDPVTSVDVMTLERPFRFMFHRLIVRAKDRTMLQCDQRRWSWLRQLYDIEDTQGRVVARLFIARYSNRGRSKFRSMGRRSARFANAGADSAPSYLPMLTTSGSSFQR